MSINTETNPAPEMESEKQLEHQFSIGDPEPLDSNVSEKERIEWLAELIAYSDDMLLAFIECPLPGEAFWLDFTSTFREHSIKCLPDRYVKKWLDLLEIRGV